MAVLIYQFGLVEVLKDEDASGWWRGYDLYRHWGAQGIGLLDLPGVMFDAFNFDLGRNKGYFYLLGGFFYVTDAATRLSAAALNCFFGALTVVLAYRIARSLFSEWVAVRVGWWSCFFLSLIIWSAQTIKEPVIIFLETLALYGCVQLKRTRFSLLYIMICTIAIVCLLPFRFYAAYVAGAAVVVTLLIPQTSGRKMTIGSALVVMMVTVGILGLSGVLAQQEAHFERYNLRYVEKFRLNASRGLGSGSGVKTDFDLDTPGGFGAAVVFGAAHLLLAPFPWQFGGGSLRMILTAPEMLVWWWLFFIGVLPGFWYAVRNRSGEVLPILFFLFGIGLLCSLAFGNVGLAYRHRAQLLPWLLILAMIGLEQRAIRKRAARQADMVNRVFAEAPYSNPIRS
jgi:4-amino-4-deoxy-L-arabinose transferase-like glycosyltransferase